MTCTENNGLCGKWFQSRFFWEIACRANTTQKDHKNFPVVVHTDLRSFKVNYQFLTLFNLSNKKFNFFRSGHGPDRITRKLIQSSIREFWLWQTPITEKLIQTNSVTKFAWMTFPVKRFGSSPDILLKLYESN